MKLPTFKYHPDPIATGSIGPSNVVCKACGQARGFIYKGPVFAEKDLMDVICPWCIADGTAHEKLDAEFVDVAEVGGQGIGKMSHLKLPRKLLIALPALVDGSRKNGSRTVTMPESS